MLVVVNRTENRIYDMCITNKYSGFAPKQYPAEQTLYKNSSCQRSFDTGLHTELCQRRHYIQKYNLYFRLINDEQRTSPCNFTQNVNNSTTTHVESHALFGEKYQQISQIMTVHIIEYLSFKISGGKYFTWEIFG